MTFDRSHNPAKVVSYVPQKFCKTGDCFHSGLVSECQN